MTQSDKRSFPLFLYVGALFLAGVSLYWLWPYSASFFEAMILFTLFNPLYQWEASLVILVTFILIVLPIIVMVMVLVTKLPEFVSSLKIVLEQGVVFDLPCLAWLDW